MATAQGIGSEGLVSEWKPTRSTWYAWWGLGTVLCVVGGLGYELLAYHGEMPTSWSINLVLTLVLVFGIFGVHEGIHGAAMMVFGAAPSFGILREGAIPVGFYATSPGYRFSRWQYLIVALAPTVIIVALGIPLCWSPIGWALWVPFGGHLGGCVGDLTIARHVFAAPADALVEDLRDGMRIWQGPTAR